MCSDFGKTLKKNVKFVKFCLQTIEIMRKKYDQMNFITVSKKQYYKLILMKYK